MGAMRARRYVRFFFERAHGARFFGGKMLAYAGAVLVLCLATLLFREGLEGVAAVFKGCAAAVLVVAQCQALGALLADRLSAVHNDHMRYLGFTPADQGLLACMVALPANVALALFVGIVFAGTFSLVVCRSLTGGVLPDGVLVSCFAMRGRTRRVGTAGTAGERAGHPRGRKSFRWSLPCSSCQGSARL